MQERLRSGDWTLRSRTGWSPPCPPVIPFIECPRPQTNCLREVPYENDPPHCSPAADRLRQKKVADPAAPAARAASSLPEMVPNPTSGCGVGSFMVAGDVQMAMEQADANARAGLAAALEASIERVAEQAREQLQGGGEVTNMSSATTGLREIIDTTLVGSTPTRRDEAGGQLWSEVCLDMETFGEIIDSMS